MQKKITVITGKVIVGEIFSEDHPSYKTIISSNPMLGMFAGEGMNIIKFDGQYTFLHDNEIKSIEDVE